MINTCPNHLIFFTDQLSNTWPTKLLPFLVLSHNCPADGFETTEGKELNHQMVGLFEAQPPTGTRVVAVAPSAMRFFLRHTSSPPVVANSGDPRVGPAI